MHLLLFPSILAFVDPGVGNSGAAFIVILTVLAVVRAR
jgi:hypothetical protein